MMTFRSHGFRNLIGFLLKVVHSLQNKLITPPKISIVLGFIFCISGMWVALTSTLIDLTSLYSEQCPLRKCFEGQKTEESNISLAVKYRIPGSKCEYNKGRFCIQLLLCSLAFSLHHEGLHTDLKRSYHSLFTSCETQEHFYLGLIAWLKKIYLQLFYDFVSLCNVKHQSALYSNQR